MLNPVPLVDSALFRNLSAGFRLVATLEDLDEASLKRILTEPKNALVKQYQRMFEMETVDLTLADEALSAIARKAIDRKTGARLAFDHGDHSAGHHVRPAELGRGRRDRDLARSCRGQHPTALHLCRPLRSCRRDRRRERLSGAGSGCRSRHPADSCGFAARLLPREKGFLTRPYGDATYYRRPTLRSFGRVLLRAGSQRPPFG